MQLQQSLTRAAALVSYVRSGSTRSVTESNIRLLYWDITWFGLLFGVTMNFLVVFVARLDANPWLMSAVTSGLLFSLYPILTYLLEQPFLIVLLAGFSGIWDGVINVALFSALTEVCPPDQRPRYIGGYTWLMNIAVFVGPVAGAALASALGVEVALVIGGLFRIIAGVLFFRFPFTAWDQQRRTVTAAAV